MKFLFFLILLLVPLTAYYYFYAATHKICFERPQYQNVNDIVALFPTDAAGVREAGKRAMEQAKAGLDAIVAIKPECRTFCNTMEAIDIVGQRLSTASSAIYILTQVSPNDEVRNAAQEMTAELERFGVDHITSNVALFEACLAYETRLNDPCFADSQALTPEQKRFVEETMRDFRRLGLQLPAEKREKIKEIHKKLGVLQLDFGQAIAAANKSIEVTKDQLRGLSESFIESLKKTDRGSYILMADMPTMTEVMRNCAVEATREQLYKAYASRAYPENEKRLIEIIKLKQELAGLLGYKSSAHFEIEHAMAKSPESVEKFLNSLVDKAAQKSKAEMELLKKHVPEGVTLSEDGSFKMWDLGYVRNQYKKTYLDIDESKIAEYFPLDTTLPALLTIYEKFFGLSFKKVEVSGLWHDGVELLAVYKDGMYRGLVILDLFPRPYKYTHAAAAPFAQSLCINGRYYPGAILMMANFPRAQEGRPALLKFKDVVTFFHEFGHVIHGLLGATSLAGFSGCAVKKDFVEMPSQMLESWMYDPEILKMVSSHYATKQPLSDAMIKKIRENKNFDVGDHLNGQLMLANASLNYFLSDNPDVDRTWQTLNQRFRPYITPVPEDKFYASMGHLVNYGSGYYGYLWSQVYALDLFNYIEKYGLLDRTIGERYICQVIGKGGSEDPADMLKAFLGREPNSDAFFKDLGL